MNQTGSPVCFQELVRESAVGVERVLHQGVQLVAAVGLSEHPADRLERLQRERRSVGQPLIARGQPLRDPPDDPGVLRIPLVGPVQSR